MCFARSSEKVNTWFKGTKLYKLVFESYAQRRTMTLKAKLMLLGPLTVLLGISFMLLASVPVARAMTVNLVATLLAILGLMGPVVGALVHSVGSVLVIGIRPAAEVAQAQISAPEREDPGAPMREGRVGD